MHFFLENREISNDCKKDNLNPEKKYEIYDDIFTTTTCITNNFKAFAPTDCEVQRAISQRGLRIDRVLLDEYIMIYRELMLQNIRLSVMRPFYLNRCVAAALEN